MPSTSKKQHNFMEMVANNPKMAKKVGVPQSVGEEFVQADKGKKFGASESRPDLQKVNRQKTDHGKMTMFKKGGKSMATKMEHSEKSEMKMDIAQDKKMIKKAFAMHDKQEHKGGKGTDLSKLKKGGSVKEARLEPAKMEPVKTSSSRDGIAQRGHTKGRNV